MKTITVRVKQWCVKWYRRLFRGYRPSKSQWKPVKIHIPGSRIKVAKKVRACSRNDPCYCGSGKKYKKCCMK